MKRWLKKQEEQEVDPEKVQLFSKELGVHELTARLLLARGLESLEDAQHFLQPSLKHIPDPFLMKGMQTACERIQHAIIQGEDIVVFGDYDVDGVTSTSLLMLFLREVGVREERLNFFIPNRMEHGYGLSPACVPEVLELGCDLVITVDCGITSVTEVDMFNEEGVDVVVLDHHLPPEQLPDAYTILNPHQKDCPYPDKRLAAVGVAYQLLIALRKTLREHGYFKYHAEPNLLKYIDLVALGTVADIVPLLGVNRVMVHYGLAQMKKTCWTGLQALLDIARVNADKLNAGTLGFQLGPRINAAGRLKDASLGVRMLCSENKREAKDLAHLLDQENQGRKELQEKMFEQARAFLMNNPEMREKKGLVLAHEEWHPGVIGIVASKLVEEFNRPIVMIAIDPVTKQGKGSCRSIPGFHLYDALDACKEHLIKFGGHAAAAGLTVDAEQIDALREAFAAYAEDNLTEEDMIPQLAYDEKLDTGAINETLVEDLQQLEPHGMKNPRPLFVAEKATILRQNKTRDGRHLQLVVDAPPYRSYKAIGFSLASYHPLPEQVDLAYIPQWDEWRGKRRLQLTIKAIRSDHPEQDEPPHNHR
jgi:single-stranded-DNA-specific exonuclease